MQPKVVVSILKSTNGRPTRAREFVGRADGYLLIVKRFVLYSQRTINYAGSRRWFVDVIVAESCHGFSAVHRANSMERRNRSGQFYVVTAKTSDKSWYRSSESPIDDKIYYADVRIAVPAHAARYLLYIYVARLGRRRHGGFNNEYAIVVSKSIDNSQAKR